MKWMDILQECTQKMRKEVQKIYGLPKASVSFGVGAGGDISKRIDLVAEKALIDCLGKHEISCTLISEELGIKKIGYQPSEYYVITDPVDGTTNAIRGLPFSANVIAVSNGPYLKDVQTAIVADIVHNITYTAQKNCGAYKNGKKIKPSKITKIEDALIGIDLNSIKLEYIVTKLGKLLNIGKHFRHFGANAQEICYVADGSLDAFIDIRERLRVTDIIASYLIIRESGGILVTPEGKELNVPLSPKQKLSFIAVSNSKLHDKIKDVLI